MDSWIGPMENLHASMAIAIATGPLLPVLTADARQHAVQLAMAKLMPYHGNVVSYDHDEEDSDALSLRP